MKSKLQKYSDQELVKELERRKEVKEKRARSNLTMLINSDIKETIRIPKGVKKIRVCDEKNMNDFKVAIYADETLVDFDNYDYWE